MLLGLWTMSVCAGATGGLFAGLVVGNWSDAIGPGGIAAGIVALAGGTIFRGDDTTGAPAFLVSIPLAGWLGGIAAAFWVDAGYLGAFVGGGAGAGSGWVYGLLPFIHSENKKSVAEINVSPRSKVEPYSKFYDAVIGYPQGSPHSTDTLKINETVDENTGNVTKNTERPSKNTAQNITPDRAKAMMIVEYSEAAAVAWRMVSKLPEAYRIAFLDALEETPSQDAAQLAARLIAAHQKEARPYDDPAANDALEKARAISAQAEEEFKTVYSLLGEVLTVDDIFSRVNAKFTNLMSNATWRSIQLSLQSGDIDLAQEELARFGYRVTLMHGHVNFGGTLARPGQNDVRFSTKHDLLSALKKALEELSRKGLAGE